MNCLKNKIQRWKIFTSTTSFNFRSRCPVCLESVKEWSTNSSLWHQAHFGVAESIDTIRRPTRCVYPAKPAKTSWTNLAALTSNGANFRLWRTSCLRGVASDGAPRPGSSRNTQDFSRETQEIAKATDQTVRNKKYRAKFRRINFTNKYIPMRTMLRLKARLQTEKARRELVFAAKTLRNYSRRARLITLKAKLQKISRKEELRRCYIQTGFIDEAGAFEKYI